MAGLIVLIGVVVLLFYAGKLLACSASGRCSRCGRFAKRLIPNEDARKTLRLCKMCNAELEIERSLKVTKENE